MKCEYLSDQTGELAMEKRSQTRLVCLRRSAALDVDRIARRRYAEDRRPGLEVDLLDRRDDRDAEGAARLTRPVVDLADEGPRVYR
jgi:hypothetical protein